MKNEKEERMERRRRKEAIEIKVLEFAEDGRKRKKWRNFLSEEKIKMKFPWNTSHAKY